MKRFIAVLLLAVLITGVYSADEDETGASGDKPAAEQADNKAVKKEKKLSETFIPSEEISEDLSVPFPADI